MTKIGSRHREFFSKSCSTIRLLKVIEALPTNRIASRQRRRAGKLPGRFSSRAALLPRPMMSRISHQHERTTAAADGTDSRSHKAATSSSATMHSHQGAARGAALSVSSASDITARRTRLTRGTASPSTTLRSDSEPRASADGPRAHRALTYWSKTEAGEQQKCSGRDFDSEEAISAR